ncbi:cotranscriptional regulator FAM172A-like [Portunus trituberculatus]|uniref:cotranscriptional regulator FAM172A-like n=1 Tax=Portunus trituberculatus TaxID=210409 RepID=UPI001E1CB806|nr:cotranscriptional regulator FAM172A-like [Portunus trituberculatus]XP_045103286.1 cotranscriptional regulator FAM172A-like [Portunus trituberculatus]XP_045103287.1 cotranscriptional regulator FAM172A-like [Portunus trituberculatus]XP_045103288.1 cotranscriptional regulator FAM172A-like [Portunus trituberculatus]
MDGFYRIKREGFPEDLADFGYEFDKEGKLRNIETGEGFKYSARFKDHYYNEKHYEALADAMTIEVYKMLESECKLKRAPVPYDVKGDEERTFIFHSEDAFTNPDKLLVLMHGSGYVKAGQWSRRLIINDSLKSGSQIPFIQEAQKEGYGVVVTNTNDNHHHELGLVRGSEHPEAHILHVWKHYIYPAKAKHIAFIVHSNGGRLVSLLYPQVEEQFNGRVFAVAMTDSNHYFERHARYVGLQKVSRNWACNRRPLDTPLRTNNGDVVRVSAGTKVHEETSWLCFNSIFKYLRERLAAVKAKEGEGEGTSEATNKESCGNGDKGGGSCLVEEELKGEVKKMKT